MTVRNSWKGSLGWGMVSCEVGVYKIEEAETEFHLYHRECVEAWNAAGSNKEEETGRVTQKKLCSRCGKELGWSEPVRGMDVAGSIVLFEGTELEGIKEEVENYAEIVGFMKWKDVDLRALSDCYYMAPLVPKAKGVVGLVLKAYRLMYEGMKNNGVCALVKIGYKGKYRLAVVQPYLRSEDRGSGVGIMLMHWVLWKGRVRDFTVLVPTGEIGALKDDELNRAKGMIQASHVDFDKVWSALKDEKTDKVEDLIVNGLLKQAKDSWEKVGQDG